ncbi:MAG: OmpA family protein, partial [Xanthomonadales bacterium]|nr:OmpA family protein [Xanthomonadales bacterium]
KVGRGSLDDLHKAITAQGKVVLDGVYFEHNKANIKAESADTLEIIAVYLKANPNSGFYVVGHTDSSGSYEYNLKLSSNRAQAVLDKLVESHNIDSAKLKAVGIGPVSPAASNANEDGQASNRRVELVLMGPEP